MEGRDDGSIPRLTVKRDPKTCLHTMKAAVASVTPRRAEGAGRRRGQFKYTNGSEQGLDIVVAKFEPFVTRLFRLSSVRSQKRKQMDHNTKTTVNDVPKP